MKNDPRIPNVGAIITRKYKGVDIEVTVMDKGFSYEGTTFKSLSKLAAHISGQKAVNGFTFFKLGKKSKAEPDPAVPTAVQPEAVVPTEAVVEAQEAPVAAPVPEPVNEPVEAPETVSDPAAESLSDLLNN